MKWIPYGRQDVSIADIEAVVAVLESDFITQGPVVEHFEQTVSDYCNVPYAVAVNSATSALHIACMAMDIGPGDLVWTSPNTFVASANCVKYCGAEVDFVDIDPQTYNLCAKALEEKLCACRTSGRPLPKLIIAVHFAGQPCDMEAIQQLAKRFGFSVIEDASHAIGASYKDNAVGNCEFSDACVFSFHPVKIITSGEGGMVVTRSEKLALKMRRHRSHGIVKEPQNGSAGLSEPWTYQQVSLGYNYRLTDIQAALGLSQMKRIGQFVDRRHQLAQRYSKLLNGSGLTLPYQCAHSRSSLHLYPVLVPDTADCGAVRSSLYHHLHQAGIGVNVHYIPVHTQPFYQESGSRQGDFPAAESYYERTISLPLFSSLSDADQDHVVETLWGFQEHRLAA